MKTKVAEFDGVQFTYRPMVSDWNTIHACCVDDEYGLREHLRPGVLVYDIGAHVGGVAIWAASKGCAALAVEPVPENAELIRQNALMNHLQNVEIVQAAMGDPPELLLRYNWHGDENAFVHSFIGNTGLGNEGYPADTEIWVPTITLSDLVQRYTAPDIIKTDCEGGEWSMFHDPAIHSVPLIVGEWHDLAKGYLAGENGRWVETQAGYQRELIPELLIHHEVTFSGPDNGAGGFRAVLR